ncbi:MAG: T9SS type A sorting domain-containing protein [Bacteroidota bacterium]|nr:T9SS type A sorting domain-containing protein [Bacteroidota bacterium]MDP4231022.1 T9SS type A sorting domain-containing protein [Bacteroidota bacterium]MDP4235719.1 T9SS type A sorting domain-containing protein [Bacteroidota bacterium]
MSPLLKRVFYTLSILCILPSGIIAQTTLPHIQWAKSFGGSDVDQAYCIEQTSDGGFIVAGSSSSDDQDVVGHHGTTDNSDCWIIKLDGSGNLVWQQSIGSTSYDFAGAIKEIPEGYIVAGTTGSLGHDVNYLILKLDENGKIIWQRTFGGSLEDGTGSIELTSDGGYVIAGGASSNNGDVTGHHGSTDSSDYWVVKVDRNGTLLWEKSYGGSGDDVAYQIKQTPDHGFIIGGWSNSTNGDVTGNHGGQDFWIVKIDSIGKLKWQKSLGGSVNDDAFSIDVTRDSGYIVTGFSNSNDGNVSGNHGSTDMWVVRLDSVGNLQWQKSLGGSDADVGYSVKSTFDGGCVIAGITASTDGDISLNQGGNDYWIVKLDSVGKLEWQKTVGGPGEDFALSIIQSSDSGYAVAGSADFNGGDINDNHGHEDFWIVKLGTSVTSDVATSSIRRKTINYPNPFTEKTTIVFNKALESNSSFILFNMLGQELRNVNIPAGSESLTLDRNGLESGVYVYRVICNGKVEADGNIVVE